MTEYGQIGQKPAPLLSSNRVQEKKETRKKLLETVFQRRRENYKQFLKKSRLHVGDDLL